MYQFVDRPVASLAPGSRLVLWAARGWAHARANGGCPPGAVAPAFLHCGAIAALPDIHRLFALLAGAEDEGLAVAAMGDPLVGDIEAVLLRLWADALDRPDHARATLSLMLAGEDEGDAGDDAAATAFVALTAAAMTLMAKGLAPVGLAEPSRAGS